MSRLAGSGNTCKWSLIQYEYYHFRVEPRARWHFSTASQPIEISHVPDHLLQYIDTAPHTPHIQPTVAVWIQQSGERRMPERFREIPIWTAEQLSRV